MPDAQPRDPELAARVAFSLHIGKTITEAAAEHSVSRVAVKSWLAADWWPALADKIANNYLDYAAALARGALLQRIKDGDAISARWLLERTDDKLAPPSRQVEVKGQIDHVAAERKALAFVPTEQLEQLAASDDEEIIDAFFEEVNPL
jgi:hypothetical protein